MDITPDEKKTLRAKVRDAIGAGLTSGRAPEAPPMPPSRSEIDKASEWAMGELTRFLASKHWDNLQARDRLEDPEFLEWEHGQVAATYRLVEHDESTTVLYYPGLAHWVNDPSATRAFLDLEDTVQASPIVGVRDDHNPRCDCELGYEPRMSGWMHRSRYDYPPPEDTTHGPLLLGPDPCREAFTHG